MVRQLITPDQCQITIELPESFIGREVEVIAFTTDEGLLKNVIPVKPHSFTIIHVEQDFKFNRDEANER